MYTLIAGTKEWSSWSLRPYLALKAIGVPFAEEVIRLNHDSTTQEVQRRSPSGRVPLLKIAENGREVLVWDSLAICETLAGGVLDADVLDVDPGPAGVGEDPGQVTGLVADVYRDDLVRGRGGAVFAGDPLPGG